MINNKKRTTRNKRQIKGLLGICSALVLVLGVSVTLVVAQNDSGLKQQEDQLIKQYVLPKAPTKEPVYKPVPAPPPRQEAPPPRRETPPEPRQEAPPPTRRETPPEPRQEAPPPRRETPPEPKQEAPPATRREKTTESETAPEETKRREESPRPREEELPGDESPAPKRGAIERETEPSEEASTEDTSDSERLQKSRPAAAVSLPTGQYTLEFNRSPVVGDRLRLRGVHSEARIGFTRPLGWKIQSAKAAIRFQHSAALLASRSNLTVRVNGTSIGSIPLNRKESQIGQTVFNIPSKLIQNYNDLTVVAQQNNDPKCSDPADATLWTEILSDSKLIFTYQPQPIPLNFSRYPYPFFDQLSLDTNRIVYLLPKVNEAWLTSAPRLQASLGRLADFRPIDTRIVKNLNQVKSNERLVVIGTPADQPALKSLELPFKISTNQILDGSKNPLPEEVGVLILTAAKKGSVPVLVATGNGPQGVNKAVQFLLQPDTSKIGTGQAILVTNLKDIPAPSPRNWPRYLPEKNSFKLSELKQQTNGKPLEDITVRGAAAPTIEFDFRALPDDRFLRGSSMTLNYSYGPQINPRTSAVEVLLDYVFIGGARLTSEDGETRKSLKVDLPANLIKPNSKIQVAFRLNPKEVGQCGLITDQQLTGTLYADSSFDLRRENSVDLPNLELLRNGFPFAAPQDLSSTAIVVPNSPSNTDLLTLLSISERLGRLSQSDSLKLNAFTADVLPSDIRKTYHLIGIGIREKFPFPEAFESGNFSLNEAFLRSTNGGSIQTLPDTEGVIKEVMSPENKERVILALSAQTEAGLDKVRQVISKDPWFFQLRKDTVLISASGQDVSSYDPDAYKLDFLQRAPSKKRIENTNLLSQASRFLQENWFVLPAGIVAIALLLYGISQLYIKRISDKKSH